MKRNKKKEKSYRTPLFWIGFVVLVLGMVYLVLNPSVLNNLSGAAMARDGENLKLSGTERYGISMFANNAVGTPFSSSNKVTSDGYLTRYGYDKYDASGLVWRAYYEKAGISFGPTGMASNASTVTGIYKATPIKTKSDKKVNNGDLVFILWKNKPVLVGIYDNKYVIYASQIKKKVVKENLKEYLKIKNKAYQKNGKIIYGSFPKE